MALGAHQGQQQQMANKEQMKIESMKTRMSPWLGGQGSVKGLMQNNTVGNMVKGGMSGMAQGQAYEQAQLNKGLAQALNQNAGNPSYGQDMISSSNSMGGSPWLSDMGNGGQFKSSLNPADFQF
jgi:hypothetical protein